LGTGFLKLAETQPTEPPHVHGPDCGHLH
jgi:hypothetical protein